MLAEGAEPVALTKLAQNTRSSPPNCEIRLIAASGIFAVLTSLAGWSELTEKSSCYPLTGVMLASGMFAAFAPNYAVFMIGSALLGVAIGGFWSMSTATVMRLVPEKSVPKALAILNGGNALAATIAAPLSSFLAALIGGG